VTEIVEAMKEEVRNDPSKPVKRIYDDRLIAMALAYRGPFPSFDAIKSTLYRVRAEMVPPVPHDLDEVFIEGEWRRTWQGEEFLSHIDNDWGILIYATDGNYRKLRRCRTLYLDGTFKSCPEPYTQVVTVHGMYHGRVLPLVWC
jgi:hypothetical protein